VPVILASATPALESLQLAEAGVIYQRSTCPTGSAAPACPTSSIVDLRSEAPERGRWLAPRLVEEMRRGWRAASNRCCSSTAAAMPR
jgi:primosomal protein N' (replication factor Y)